MLPNYLKKELSILFYIVNKNQTSTKEIARHLSMSKRSVNETLAMINKHFSEYRKIPKFIVTEQTGLVHVNPKLRVNAVHESYLIKLSLLKNNVTFNYCVLLTTRVAIDKEEIIEKLFISPSYLTKLTQKLNHYFSVFNFNIVCKQNSYQLEGNEMHITLFCYLFLQDAFQDLEWPFSHISIQNIRNSVPKETCIDMQHLSDRQQHSLYMLYATLQNRVEKHCHAATQSSNSIQTLLTIMQEEFDISVFFQNNRLENSHIAIQESEVQYINFLSHIFISDIIPKTVKIKIGKKFFEEDHAYCKLTRDILTASSNVVTHNLSDENKYLYAYYLTIFHPFYDLFSETINHFIQLLSPPLFFHTHTENEFMLIIKDNIAPFTKDKNHHTLLSNLLYSLYTSRIKTEVNIYLHVSKDYAASFFIENKLSHFFNNKNIMITDNYDLSDIVVTDILDQTLSEKKIFYLDSIRNDNSWQDLLYVIQSTYLEKQNALKSPFST